MRICYTSDLHGLETLYAQLDDLLRREQPDLLILGGDLFADGSADDPFAEQGRYLHECFLPRLAALRRDLPALSIACINGNHDWLFTRHILEESQRAGLLVRLDLGAPWQTGGQTLLGYSHAPPSPFGVKDFERLDDRSDPLPAAGGAVWDAVRRGVRHVEPADWFLSQPTIAEELARVQAPAAPWIFVCHAPPHNTGLDCLPQIDAALGSRSVREFIERCRPRVSLHGHFHEAPEVSGRYFRQLGDTLCINPGQHNERLHAVLFDAVSPAATLRHTVLA
jgi:Icc-related predicted phosphoesterase